MKRSSSPVFWPIQRKKWKYIVEPMPGPHGKKRCITTTVLLRNILKFADNVSEVRDILKKNQLKINNRRVKKYNFPIGLMDLIELEDEKYRVVPTKRGLGISKTDNTYILAKVINKTKIKGDKTQLNLHNGSNILSDEDISTGDVLVLENGKIKEKIKLEKKASVIITQGTNEGKIGKIKDIKEIRSSKPNKVYLKINGEDTEVPIDYVFPIKDNFIEVNKNE